MKTRERDTTATLGTSRFAMVGKLTIAASFLVPAILINADLAGSQPWEWKVQAAFSIVVAAAFAECGVLLLLERALFAMVLPFALALFMMSVNLQTAMDSASTHSDLARDGRTQVKDAAGTRTSQQSEWSQKVAAQVAIAGQDAPDKIESDMQALITQNAKRWKSTDQCTPTSITAGESATFCTEVNKYKGKKAAATERDRLQLLIDASRQTDAGQTTVVTSVDPYADNVVAFLGAFGVKFTADGKEAITAARNASKSIGLEIMATFGPGFVLMMFELTERRRRRMVVEPLPVVAAARAPTPKKPEPKLRVDVAPPIAPLPVSMDNAIHGFIAAEVERCEGAKMKAGDAWSLWQAYAAKQGIPAGSQRVFGETFGAFFVRDNNNNRPLYLNVRAKQGAPGLRVAVDNTRSALGVMTTVGARS